MTLDPRTIDAAVFDIGGVFLYPHPGPVRARLAELGLPVPEGDDPYRRAHHGATRVLSDALGAVDERDPSVWELYDDTYAASLGVPEGRRADLRVAVRTTWGWAHQANIDAFHRLAATGLPLAIVSNNNGTAPDQMREHGVCWVNDTLGLPVVAAIIDSALVGVAKPDPAIFTPAIHALGLPPERCLYVGDTVHADVGGATAADMQVVQLDPFDQHADMDHERLPDLSALVDVVT